MNNMEGGGTEYESFSNSHNTRRTTILCAVLFFYNYRANVYVEATEIGFSVFAGGIILYANPAAKMKFDRF